MWPDLCELEVGTVVIPVNWGCNQCLRGSQSYAKWFIIPVVMSCVDPSTLREDLHAVGLELPSH